MPETLLFHQNRGIGGDTARPVLANPREILRVCRARQESRWMLNVRFITLLTCCLFLIPTAQGQQFIDLLKDRDLSQWMLPSGEDVQQGWVFDDEGQLHLDGRGGNIITRDEFGDFDLWFEYKISEKGNSGIKYRVRKFGNSWLGCEYQIQDDAAFPRMATKHYTASIYDLVDLSSPVLERNYGDPDGFSIGHIQVHNHRIRHWMNGNLIIDENDTSERFAEAIQNSKFRNVEGFGVNTRGRIMLTDHSSEVWYRNIYIRRLDEPAAETQSNRVRRVRRRR